MSLFTELRDGALKEGQHNYVAARLWGAFNAASVVAAALLAGAAAVTAAAAVPSWITALSAGLSAAIGALTAGFRPAETRNLKCKLHADWERLAGRWTQVEALRGAGQPTEGDWYNKLEEIKSKLTADEPVDEGTWAAARVPPISSPAPANA